MEKKVYIISFGNSTKYRFTPEGESLNEIRADIRKYLAKKFPELADPKYFEHMTVTEVNAANEDEYRDYPEFNTDSIKEIKAVLSREVENGESVRELNSNAPWGIGAEKD